MLLARRARQAAEAAGISAAARPNPTVSLNATAFKTSPFGGGSPDTIARIDQPIERGSKRDLRMAVAQAALEASQLDESDTLRQQMALARQAFFDLKALEQKYKISNESARLARDVLKKAELRLRAGDLSAADVARIRTDSLRVDNDAAQARVDLKRGQIALAQLLALERDSDQLVTAGEWPVLGAMTISDMDIESRPDVNAAQKRVITAEKALELARSLQTRDISIGAQLERNAQQIPGTLIGMGISVPLFTGYDFRGEIQRAYVDRDTARDELDRIRAQAKSQYDQYSFEYNTLKERALRLQDEALPSARKAYNAVQLAFTQGAASVLDLIDARRSLYATEIDAVNAIADAAKAQAAFAAAVNNPTWQQP